MKKILLVEDDLFERELYAQALKEAGYEITEAVDGQEGIDKASVQKFDLVLLDIMLPKKTGLEVLEEFKNTLNKETPIILLTNLGQPGVIKKAFKLGAVGFLLKARLLPQEVVKKINQFFEFGPSKLDLKDLGL